MEKQVRIPQLEIRVDYDRAALYGIQPAAITEALTLSASYAFTDTEITKGCDDFQYTLNTGGIVYNPALGTVKECNISGNRYPLAPEETQRNVTTLMHAAPDVETGVRRVVLLALKSPHFLYTEVPAHDSETTRTATRLAFSLWDSAPDAELARAAKEGRLRTREEVSAQAARLLTDQRARAKVRQWFKAQQLEQTIAQGRAIVEREWHVEERTALEVTVLVGGEALHRTWALNEVSLEKAARERMVDVLVEIDGRPLSRWGCDGVVCATPTGSTAYAMSAGGPLLHPSIAAWVMVPIAPHTLSNRPIALADSAHIAIEIVAGRDASANFDMQSLASLMHGDRIEVTRSQHKVRFLHPKGWTYFDTLRQKMHWNEGVA